MCRWREREPTHEEDVCGFLLQTKVVLVIVGAVFFVLDLVVICATTSAGAKAASELAFDGVKRLPLTCVMAPLTVTILSWLSSILIRDK